MTIETEAEEFDGPQIFTGVKVPGRELQLVAQDIDGNPLGTITLSRVDRLDTTILTVDAGSRGKAIREWLSINGLEDADINPTKKRGAKTFDRADAVFTISPFKRSVYFLDRANNRQYRTLRVTLQAANG